jgi:hypothetical protein
MKNMLLVLAAGTAAVAAVPAGAQTRPGFELGGEIIDYSYSEWHEGALVARDDGPFGGFGLGYVETIGGGSFLRARFHAGFGSVNYRSGDGETRIDNVFQSTGLFELHFGKDFRLGTGGASITPFVGVGSRVLIDESGGRISNDGLEGYDRELGYAYVPIGVAAGFTVGGATRLTLSGQFNWVFGGTVESKFSELDPDTPDVKLDLDGGHGFELSAIVSTPVGGKAINLRPFVRHWTIDQSKSFVLSDSGGSGESIEFFEPRNRATELGLRLSLSF